MNRASTLPSARGLLLASLAVLAWACGPQPTPEPEPEPETAPAAQSLTLDDDEPGAFTSDFIVPSTFPSNQLGPVIERDRMYMAARPGFQLEYTPLRLAENGDFLTGGRYLWENFKRAKEYKQWVETQFILDGTVFIQRDYIVNREFHAWIRIGHADLGDVRTEQWVVRTERFTVPAVNQRSLLKGRWQALLDEATLRGYTGLWLLYNPDESLVSLVYFANRVAPSNPLAPDFASLSALELALPLGNHFSDQQGWTRVFDRTSWVAGVWFPFVLGDRGEAALWPYSPPFPAPYAGDGVCAVSRGENSTNAPECLPTCGNGVADAGEDTLNCPGDVRVFPEAPGTQPLGGP